MGPTNSATVLAAWLRAHHGVVDRRSLERLGVTEKQLRVMLHRGELSRLLPGVYVSAHLRIGRDQMLQAVCQRNDTLAIGFTTAGQLWGLRKMTDPRLHVLLPHGHSPELDEVIVHRCRDVIASDIVEREDGLRVTSPARTLFDASSIIGVRRTESALEHALELGLVDLPTMLALCERLARRRRPGSRQMRIVLGGRPLWRRAVESDLEVRVLRALEKSGLPTPVTQFVLMLPDGHSIRFDFAWPPARVALEVDHPFWHGGREAQHRDKARDRRAAALGWTVLRITDWDVEAGMDLVTDDLRAVLRRT